jgi:hypothetical protein
VGFFVFAAQISNTELIRPAFKFIAQQDNRIDYPGRDTD